MVKGIQRLLFCLVITITYLTNNIDSTAAIPVKKLPDPLVISIRADASKLDPARMTGSDTQSILQHIFDHLVFLNPKGEIVPWLATEWKWKDDKTLIMKLRQDVVFHNGEKFDAEDVKYSLERYIDSSLPEKTRAKTLLKICHLSSVEVIDPYTVAIKTSFSSPALIPVLTRYSIMPKGYYSKSDLNTLIDKPIGSGPFKFKSWVKDEKIILTANETYWMGKPKVDQLIYRPISETGTAISELMTGNVHIVKDIPPDLLGGIKNKTTRVSTCPGERIMFIGMITNNPKLPTYNKKVRQALNYAVDKEAITKMIFHGMTKPYDGFLFAATENSSVKAYPYDPKKAKKLLKEAGFPKGFELKMGTSKGLFIKDSEISQVIAQYLSQVGIKVTIQSYDTVRYAQIISKKEASPFSLYFFGQGGWPSMLQALGRTLDIRQNPWGLHQWKNEKFIDFYDRAAKELDKKKHTQHCLSAQEVAWDDCPFIFLYHQPAIAGVNKSLNWDIWSNEWIRVHYTVLDKLKGTI